MIFRLSKRQLGILLCLVAVGLVVIGLSLGLLLGIDLDDGYVTPNRDGMVVTNGHECAEIGGKLLQRGGSAVDAAIGAMLCEGIAMPQSMGIGGGFLMTIYIREQNIVETINAREMAPALAHEDMFEGNQELARKGGLAVAIPGELRGFWAAHKRYGRLKWADVVRPAMELAEKGHLVTKYLAKFFKNQEDVIQKSPTLKPVFINPITKTVYVEGDLIKRTQLAETLRVVMEEGADALYDGSLTKKFVEDIKNANGIITVEDMNQYEAEWLDPIRSPLPSGQTMYTVPLPGSGVLLGFIMNILSDGFLDHNVPNSPSNWQRIVEAFKYGFGKRTELGDRSFVPGIDELMANLTSLGYAESIRALISDDETFQDPEHYGANTTQPEDSGTAHISILANNGDAVSVTGTINLYFGAGFMSTSTGIILNDEMDDFSAEGIVNAFDVPPSPANYIKPGKRPLSSMCPAIVVDEKRDVRLIVGAAGGTKITTSVALIIMQHLWFRMPIQRAMDSMRLHHQLFPMEISFESDFDKGLISDMAAIGHNYTVASPTDGFAAAIAIASDSYFTVSGAYDRNRRTGSTYLVPKTKEKIQTAPHLS